MTCFGDFKSSILQDMLDTFCASESMSTCEASICFEHGLVGKSRILGFSLLSLLFA